MCMCNVHVSRSHPSADPSVWCSVSGKIPLPILPEDSLRVSQIASACEESIRTHAFVELDYGSHGK